MNTTFDSYHAMEPPRIHLATPDRRLLTTLNGVQPDSVSLKMELNNAWSLSFTVDRFLSDGGTLSETSGYRLLDDRMKLFVDNIGWFIMKVPSVSNDGACETKSVEAESTEIEWIDKSLKGFKINCGTTDSMEMLIPGNTEIIGGVEFPKRQIRFCDKEDPRFSLLHIAMKAAGLNGWEVGYVDEIPKVYTSYQDGEYVEKTVQLKDEIGTFDLSASGLYSFFTQDLAKFYECLFQFDIQNFRVNVYRVEHLGKDTNVTISFRNFQNSNDITCSNTDDICTCCYVSGGDDLGIEQVNFGWNYIEDLSYFLNTRYLPGPLIAKYNEWNQYMESRRYEYIDLTRRYNAQLDLMSELENRVPLDDCSTDWNKFSDEKLLQAKDNYTAQKTGLESFYVDENGDFDEAKLAASDDADTYYQVRDVILPSIEIERTNRGLPTSVGKQDYIDTYLTDWKLYGTAELSVKLEMYRNQKEVCEAGHYDLPYDVYDALANDKENVEAASQYPAHTRDMHEEMHAKFEEALLQLDESVSGSCAEAYAKRMLAYGEAEQLAEQIFEERATLVESVTKETWNMDGVDPFTEEELETLSRLASYTDYVNDNMFLTDSDSTISALDERLRLLDAARADLESTSRPQYTYNTSLENFLSDYGYRELTKTLELGDFLYLEAQEDYLVKLRLISLSYNPMKPGDNLNIGFSNMISTASKRYDATYLLDLRGYSGRNQISGTPGSSLKSEGGVSLLPELLEKILSSSQYTNNVQHAVDQHFQSILGQLVVAKGMEAEMIKATDLTAGNGFFQYLQSALIAADKIVADSGDFKNLSALVGSIDSLLSGTISAELGHIIRLTAENVHIDEAVIRDLIAANITVAMLQAGEISADKFHIASDDGGLVIAGNTMQLQDASGVVRIQIGRDAKDQFTFCLYDKTGKGILIDSSGIKESALSDGLIKNQMLAGGITKDKLAFRTVETDANGKVNASEVLLNGQGLDMKFKTVEEDLDGQMKAVTASIKEVGLKVDQNTQAITTKVSQSDIKDSLDKYDQSTGKLIRDRVTKTETDISGIRTSVSDVSTKLTGKADSSSVTELTTRLADFEQDVTGFKTQVSSTYATKDSLRSYPTTTEMKTAIDQKADSITASVNKSIDGITSAVSEVTQRADRIESTVQDTKGALDAVSRQTSEFIIGTQSAETGSWTGNASFTKLSDGQQITYWLPFNGSGNAALDLTLSGGTKTGPVACYYGGTTRLTTQYPAGSVIRMTYRKDITIGTSATKYTGWWADANYNTDSTDRTRYASTIKAKNAVPYGTLIVSDTNGYFPIAPGVTFDTNKQILWAGSALAAGAAGTNNFLMYSYINLTLTKSGWSGKQYAPVYLTGTLNGTSFTVSDPVFTTTVPAKEDGLTYILLGQTYSTTNMVLVPEHPMYRYVTDENGKNGAFKSFEQIAYEASAVSSRVTQTAEAIRLEVENARGGKATLQLKVNEIVGKITAVEGVSSEAKQTADLIKQKVEHQQIGGTNILRGTNTVTELTPDSSWSQSTWGSSGSTNGTRTSIAVSNAPNANIRLGWRFLTTADTGAAEITQYDVPVISGQQYTLSCYARCTTGNSTLKLQYKKTTSYSKTLDLTSQNSQWGKYSYTFTLPATAGSAEADLIDISFAALNKAGTLEICGMQLELGDTPTDWSPAPEEITSSITSVELKADEYQRDISKTLDGIRTNINTVTSTANGTKETITSLEKEIGGLKDNDTSLVNRLTDVVYQNTLDKTAAELRSELKKEIGSKAESSVLQQTYNQIEAVFNQYDMAEIANQSYVRMNANGIEIGDDQAPLQKTVISKDSFSGSYNGEEVFTLSKDELRTVRVYVKNGMDMDVIKYVPLTVNGVRGIAHVKSGGTS